MTPAREGKPLEVGAVVYCEGSSAILGDVIEVTEEGIVVEWRATVTTEQEEDLIRAEPEA